MRDGAMLRWPSWTREPRMRSRATGRRISRPTPCRSFCDARLSRRIGLNTHARIQTALRCQLPKSRRRQVILCENRSRIPGREGKYYRQAGCAPHRPMGWAIDVIPKGKAGIRETGAGSSLRPSHLPCPLRCQSTRPRGVCRRPSSPHDRESWP